MTVHLFRDMNDSRRVLVKEQPPRAKDDHDIIDDAVYVDTMAWGGIVTNDRGSTTPVGPWVIRLDDSIPEQKEQLELLLIRMSSKDKRGGALMPNIVPFSPTYSEMRADEVNAEVDRLVAEKLAAKEQEMEARLAEKYVTPAAVVSTTGTIGGSTQYGARGDVSGKKSKHLPTKNTQMWDCPVCNKHMQLRGKYGHARMSVQNGHTDHLELRTRLEAERKMAAMGVA